MKSLSLAVKYNNSGIDDNLEYPTKEEEEEELLEKFFRKHLENTREKLTEIKNLNF